MQPFSTVLSEGRVIVPANNEANSLYQDGYGLLEAESGLLVLEGFEVLYLLERGKISVIDENNHERQTFRKLLNTYIKNVPNIWTYYIVYRDLRTRGFITKRGPGWGLDFYVYERGSYRKREPKNIVYSVWEGLPEDLIHLEEMLSDSVELDKNLRLAVVDRRGEIVYYTVSEKELVKKEI